MITARGLTANWSLGGEKIIYCLFCIFVIIISSSSIIISFVLNSLYLNPGVSPFVHLSSPSWWGGRGGVSEQLSGAELPAAGLNHDREEGEELRVVDQE